MQKDFDRWNEVKKEIDNKKIIFSFSEREIWWSVIGENIGVEINGKHELYLRPVVIIRKFNKYMTLVVPTTAKDKFNNRYYMTVSGNDGKSYNVCLSQIKALSSKRLFRKIGTIKKEDHSKLIINIINIILKDLQNNEIPL